MRDNGPSLWTDLGGLIALCIAVGETGPTLLGLVTGALLPEAMLRVFVAPTLIGMLLIAAAGWRTWNPLRRGPRQDMRRSTVAVLILCGLSSLLSVPAGFIALARARLASKLVYKSALLTATGCDGPGSVRAKLQAEVPEETTAGTLDVCGIAPTDSVRFVLSHDVGYVEERGALPTNTDCERIDFNIETPRFEATFCFHRSTSTNPKEPLVVYRAIVGGKEVPIKSREKLRWYESPAYWF